MHKQPTMKYSGYWPSIAEMNPDNHVFHTFLSCNLSITPTNDGPVLMDFTFGQPEQFQNYTSVTSDVPKLLLLLLLLLNTGN